MIYIQINIDSKMYNNSNIKWFKILILINQSDKKSQFQAIAGFKAFLKIG